MQSPSTSTCVMDGFRCRLCFKSSDRDLQPLFPPGEECFVNDLLSQIYDCLAIHVSFLEDFCSVVCSGCRQKVHSFYNFKKQCQSNDDYLREKRSRDMNGVELERKVQECQTDWEVESSRGQVKEPNQEELMDQAESIFFPKEQRAISLQTAEKCVETVDVGVQMDLAETISSSKEESTTSSKPEEQIVEKVDVGVQMFGTNSNESFCGFADEFFSRRSPRIFIKNSITEAFEMIRAPSVTQEEMQECHVPIEKLDIKPSIPDLQPCVDAVKSPITPKKEKGKKEAKPAAILKDTEQSPRLLRQKAVLFYDGFEYRKPRSCHDKTTAWVCCKISCPATLEQKADGKLKLNANHKQHTSQVVRDTMVVDRKTGKWVPFMVTNNNQRRKVICDDAFRYRFSQKLPNGQTVWTCEAQQGGCKAYLRIMGDFRAVSKVFKHNHTEMIMVHRRKPVQKEKLSQPVKRKLIEKA